MSFAEDREAFGKAERKERLEADIEAAIDRLEEQAEAPSAWQKSKILHAIDATTRGLFDVAATHISQVFAEAGGRNWGSPDIEAEELDAVTVTTMRASLEKLRSLPVQDPPDYL